MQLRIAKRMEGIEASPTLKLNALAQDLARQGKDIVNLTAGETDFDTDASVKAAACLAIEKNFTRYTPTHGIPELRQEMARWFSDVWGLSYQTSQLTITSGAKQGIFNFMMAVLDPGDEVIIPAPYWVSYPEMARMMGATPVIVPSDPAEGFLLDPAEVKKRLSPKTKLLVLNSPNNPTGAVYSRESLQELARVLEGTDVLVASDEIYGSLCYDGMRFTAFASLSADAMARTVTFNGLSKSHAMTGWRVGFAAGPQSIINTMGIIQGQSSTHIPSFVQKACVDALRVPAADIQQKCQSLKARRDLMLGILTREPRIKLLAPKGAFYLFPDFSAFWGMKGPKGQVIRGSDTFAEYLLEEVGLAVVPGRPFGEDRCIRISFSGAEKILREGSERLLSALQRLTP